MTWYKIKKKKNYHNRSYMGNLCASCQMDHFTRHQKPSPEAFRLQTWKIFQTATASAHHLRILQAQIWDPQLAALWIQKLVVCFSCVFIETYLIKKCLTASIIEQIYSNSKSQQGFSFSKRLLNEKIEFSCSEERRLFLLISSFLEQDRGLTEILCLTKFYLNSWTFFF